MIKDEKGFTVVELIITVAVIAIFSTIIVSVVSTTSHMMSVTSNTTSIQTSVQQVTDDMKEKVMEVNGAIYYAYGKMFSIGTEVTDRNDMNRGDVREKTLYLESKTDSGNDLEMITWDPATKQLLYQKVTAPYVTQGKIEVLAKEVSDFRVDISKADTEQYITFQVTIMRNEKQYSMSQIVSLRNAVEIKAPF